MGKGQIGCFVRGLSGSDGKINLAVLNGSWLFAGIKLCQGQGNVRITAGKGIVNLAVDDSAAVWCSSQTDQSVIRASDSTHTLEHSGLLIQNFLGRFNDISANCSRGKLAVIAKKKQKTKG